MKTKYIRADEVRAGDTVFPDDQDGGVKVKSIAKGLLPGHVRIAWSNGFSEARCSDQVEVLR